MDRLASVASLTAQKIFDNIIFLEEIFGDRGGEELPDVPFLELAKSFELKSGKDTSVATQGGGK